MSTTKTDRIIAILGSFVVLLVGAITVYSAYDLHALGEAAPKALLANYMIATDPLSDIRSQGEDLAIEVRSRGADVSNLRMLQTTLTNTGKSPITPSDFVEPLTLSTASPWRIINVANSPSNPPSGPRFVWERQSATVFRARPTLMNPGDMEWAIVYLTRDGPSPPTASESPTVRWDGRIVNLSRIEEGPSAAEQFAQLTSVWFITIIWGWGVVFFFLSFSLYNALTILLMIRNKFVRPEAPSSYLWIVLASLLNIGAADAGTTYVFGQVPMVELPIDHISNATPLAGNAIMLLWLFISARRRKRPA